MQVVQWFTNVRMQQHAHETDRIYDLGSLGNRLRVTNEHVLTVSRIKVDMHKIKKQSFSHSPDLQNKFSLTRDETVGGYRGLTMSVVFTGKDAGL